MAYKLNCPMQFRFHIYETLSIHDCTFSAVNLSLLIWSLAQLEELSLQHFSVLFALFWKAILSKIIVEHNVTDEGYYLFQQVSLRIWYNTKGWSWYSFIRQNKINLSFLSFILSLCRESTNRGYMCLLTSRWVFSSRKTDLIKIKTNTENSFSSTLS